MFATEPQQQRQLLLLGHSQAKQTALEVLSATETRVERHKGPVAAIKFKQEQGKLQEVCQRESVMRAKQTTGRRANNEH